MARPYRIRDGACFAQADGTRAAGGQVIELEDDVAQAHADKLEPLAEAAGDATPPADPADDPTRRRR
jgi:hypothetical protein